MSDFYIPKEPVNIPTRPFDKGIVRNVPSNVLPSGAVFDAKNLMIIDGALKKRPGLDKFGVSTSGTQQALSFPVRGSTQLWKTNGTAVQSFWDDCYLYVFGSGAYTRQEWGFSTGILKTIGSNTVTVRGTNMSWAGATNLLKVGDYISFGGATAGTIRRITALNNRTITLASAIVGGIATGSSYKIKRTFHAQDPYIVDWTVIDNKLVMTDNARPLYYFDGSTLTRYITHTVTGGYFNWWPATITAFNNRLWGMNTHEGPSWYRQRIRWTQVTDHDNFLDSSGTDTQYLDLPYSMGEGRKILGMANMLVAYLTDAIYVGVLTNMPTLPVSFDRVETGGIGLVGTRAVASFLGVHFFVGTDDIYTLQSKGIQRIGTPIVRQTIRNCAYPQFIRVSVDAANDRVCFGFPESSSAIQKVWNYYYKTGGWTYDEYGELTSLDFVGGSSSITWDNWDTYMATKTWDAGTLQWTSWDSMASSVGEGKMMVGTSSGRVFQFSTDGAQDAFDPATSIPILLEIGDQEYGEPDSEKTWLRLSIKLQEVVTTALNLTATVSTDRGRTWKSVGILQIGAGLDEGYVSFRATGSLFRFRLEATTSHAPYSIQEAVLRVRGRGLETRASAT